MLKHTFDRQHPHQPHAHGDGSAGGGHGEGSFLAVVLAGGCAGSFSHALVHPFDTIKARMQIVAGPVSPKMSQVAKSIVSTQGWGGLMRGLLPSVLHAFPTAAIGFVAYESVIKMLNKL